MNKYLKTGLLMLTLVFPVLIFLFLKIFTTNQYDLPYLVPLREGQQGQVQVVKGDTVYFQLKAFDLYTTDGKVLDNAALAGKTTLFVPLTSLAPDSAGQTVTVLSRVAGMLGNYPEMRILTLIDSADQKKLVDLIKQTSGYGPHWLIGVASKNRAIRIEQDVFGFARLAEEDKTISATSRLSLLDSQGFIRGYYQALNPEEIERLMAEIRILEHNRLQQ